MTRVYNLASGVQVLRAVALASDATLHIPPPASRSEITKSSLLHSATSSSLHPSAPDLRQQDACLGPHPLLAQTTPWQPGRVWAAQLQIIGQAHCTTSAASSHQKRYAVSQTYQQQLHQHQMPHPHRHALALRRQSHHHILALRPRPHLMQKLTHRAFHHTVRCSWWICP